MAGNTYETEVCIVGGGPAGMLLGLLLARHNVKVLVLEQHPDFEREYRGEVLMPRFAQLFSTLGLYDYIQTFPHTKIREMAFHSRQGKIASIVFNDISKDYPFAFWMTQPVFLNALYQHARDYPTFDLWFNASVKSLLLDNNQTENGKTKGIVARVHHENADEEVEIRAKVTVGADGRFSKVFRLGRFEHESESHKFDVLWFSLPRPAGFKSTAQTFIGKDRLCVMLPKHPDLIQCGVFMKPEEYGTLKQRGIEAMRQLLRDNGPSLFKPFIDQLKDFSPFTLLQASTAYTRQWAKDGLLLIGDAAHTCSPVGGIGVSVALKTAAVAADVLEKALQDGDVSASALGNIQRLRARDVKEILDNQTRMFNGMSAIQSPLLLSLATPVIRLLLYFGIIQKIMRRIVVDQDNP